MRNQWKGNDPLIRRFWLCLVVVGLQACTIQGLRHEGIESVGDTKSGAIAVADSATGLTGGRIGWGRLSLFYIPVAPIHIRGDESVQMMNVVGDALLAAGYEVSKESKEESQIPVLRCHVNKARFNNYTWLAPIVPTWGGVDVRLSLDSPDGHTLWSRQLDGGGVTFNFFDGYDVVARKAITKLANQMAEAFSGDDFYQALNSVQSLPEATEAPVHVVEE